MKPCTILVFKVHRVASVKIQHHASCVLCLTYIFLPFILQFDYDVSRQGSLSVHHFWDSGSYLNL